MSIPYGTLRDIANELKNIREILEKQYIAEGEWIESEIPNEIYVCSECGGACWSYDYERNIVKSNYCPNCGAKMKSEE